MRTSENHFCRRESLLYPYQSNQSKIDDRSSDIHQTDTFAEDIRKCKQNVDRWTKPSPQSLVAAPKLVELVDLVLDYGKNPCGGVAFIELGSERMRGKTLSSLFSVCLEGFFEDDIEVGNGFRRCGRLGE